MISTDTQPSAPSSSSRLFYPIASLLLLAVTAIGFRYFYLHLQAFPGRPLTPPIRTVVTVHGILMTAWMLLAVVQPLLVATGRKRLHIKLGQLGAVLAAAMIVAGYLTAIHATRVNPPDLKLFGLTPKEFLTVPLSGVVAFGGFVLAGVSFRRRPEVHRPMMLMASLSIVSAALGRMPELNGWYAGTPLEYWLSAFVSTLVLGALLLALKCALERRFDVWFAGAFGALALVCVLASVIARTPAWAQLATALVR